MNEAELEEALDRAWGFLESGDVAGAARLAEKLTKSAPEAADPHVLLAACAREEGETPRALAALARAAELDPAWGTPHLWTAEILSEDPDRLAEALRHASEAMDRAEEEIEFLDALALKAGLEVDLGRPAAARRTLAELPAAAATDAPPEIAMELAHLFLAVEDAAEARRRFEALVREMPDMSDAWHGLGLACDALNDEEGRRKAWLEVLMLDRGEPDDRRVSDEEIEADAEGVLTSLPERARALLANVPIIVADHPAKRDVENGVDPRLLGMFVGTAYPDESTVMGTAPQLTQILLFRRNLERVTADAEELRDEIRTTIVHEVGHFFGLSEADLAEMGLA